MKTMLKRATSIIMALCMMAALIPALGPTALAATENLTLNFSYSASTVAPGEEVTVTVSLANYTDTSIFLLDALSVEMELDTAKLEFVAGSATTIATHTGAMLTTAYNATNRKVIFTFLPLLPDETIARTTNTLFSFRVKTLPTITATVEAEFDVALKGRDTNTPALNLNKKVAAPKITIFVETSDPAIAITSTGLGALKVGQAVTGSIVFTLSNGTYATTITPANFEVSGLPVGLTAGTATRTGNTVVTVPITGTPTTANASASAVTLPTSIPMANVTDADANITPTGTVSASAVAKGDQTAPAAPTVSGTPTTASITLNTITGAEYRQGTTGAWQDSPVFTGLTPGTGYTFFARLKETSNLAASPASAASAVIQTQAGPAIAVTSTGLGALKVGQAVTGSIIYTVSNGTYATTITPANFAVTGLPAGLSAAAAVRTSDTVVTIQVTGAPTAASTSTASVVLPTSIPMANVAGAEADITRTGTVTASAVAKGDQTAPAAPTVSGTPTSLSITLSTITGAEYRIASPSVGAWQSSPTFSGLTPNTGYTFNARLAETTNYAASPASAASAVITTAPLPPAIAITSTGLTGLRVGQAVTGASIIFTLSNGTYATTITAANFAVTGLPAGLTAGTAVRTSNTIVTVPITGTPTTHTTSAASITLPSSIPQANVTGATANIAPTGTVSASAVAKGDQTAPAAPTVSGTPTTTSITLNTITGAEYRQGTTGAWQDSPTFTGLTPNTGYTFFARLKETANLDASPISAASATITTATASVTYTVTFNGNGGAPATQIRQVTTPATTVGTLPTITREGHSFSGWNTAANGSGASFTSATPVTGNITVFAQWTPNSAGNVTSNTDATLTFAGIMVDLESAWLNNTELTINRSNPARFILSGYPGYTGNIGEAVPGSTIITLYKEFLATLSAGTYTLKAAFAAAGTVYAAPEMGFVISPAATPPPPADSGPGVSNAALSPVRAEFDKSDPKDIVVSLNRGSYNLNSITHGSHTLVAGTDYTVSGNAYTIKASYLETLGAGERVITFNMSGGSNPRVTVTVKEPAAKTQIALTVGQRTYTVNGATRTMDVAPMIVDSRTLVPLRFVAEALGAKVGWNATSRTATVELDGKTLAVTIGQLAPGMDVPASLADGRTMVPLRYISEALGCTVDWNPATQAISIVR